MIRRLPLYKLLISLLCLGFLSGLWFYPVDTLSKTIVDDSLKEAVIVFGVAKGLNAAISMAQGTQITAIPGFIIAIGEALDPLNDLVEQFSWVMLASITSLGIQKILSNIIVGNLYTILLVGSVALFNLWLYVRFRDDQKIRAYFMRFVTMLIFLRIAIPLMAVANIYIYEHYVKHDYNIEKTQMAVSQSSQELQAINSATATPNRGFWDSVSEKFDTAFYKQKLAHYEQIATHASENILNLMVAFIFKTIVFPLIFLFLLYKIASSLIRFERYL